MYGLPALVSLSKHFGDQHLQRLSTKMTFFNRFQHPLAQPTVEKEKAATIVIDLDAMTGKKKL